MKKQTNFGKVLWCHRFISFTSIMLTITCIFIRSNVSFIYSTERIQRRKRDKPLWLCRILLITNCVLIVFAIFYCLSSFVSPAACSLYSNQNYDQFQRILRFASFMFSSLQLKLIFFFFVRCMLVWWWTNPRHFFFMWNNDC